MNTNTLRNKAVNGYTKADNATFDFAQALNDWVSEVKYDREQLMKEGKAFYDALTPEQQATFRTAMFRDACDMAGIDRKVFAWMLNGMGLTSAANVSKMAKHGTNKPKSTRGRKAQSEVEKIAASASKLSASERKELIKLLQAM